jgi:hypothetical protein
MGVNTVLASGGAFTAPTQATGYPDETVPRTLGKPPLLDSEVGEGPPDTILDIAFRPPRASAERFARFWVCHQVDTTCIPKRNRPHGSPERERHVCVHAWKSEVHWGFA